MIPNSGAQRILEGIFNEGMFGNTLKGVLHQSWPGLDGNPTSGVATYSGYASIDLIANDNSLFNVSGNSVSLNSQISWPIASSGTQEIQFASICTGDTGGDEIIMILVMGGGPVRAYPLTGLSNAIGNVATNILTFLNHGLVIGERMFVPPGMPGANTTITSGTYYVSSTSFDAGVGFRLTNSSDGSGVLGVGTSNNRVIYAQTHMPPVVTTKKIIRVGAGASFYAFG
jgi:hypothetical protein